MTGYKSDLITVIIPTYNRLKKVERAIRSVLAQTYENFQLIVVDDGSTDGTADMVRSLADPRIELIHFAENRGVNAARNAGMEQARGFWIVFLDSDDYYYPNALAKYYECASSAPKNIGIIRFNSINSVTGKISGRRPDERGWSTEIVSYEEYLLAPNNGEHFRSIRPQTLESGVRHPEWINGYPSLFFTTIMKQWDCMFVSEVIGVIDREESSDRLSQNREIRQPEPYARAFALYLDVHRDVLQRYPEKRAKLSSRIALCYGYLGERQEGTKWLIKAIRSHPRRFWYPIKIALLPIIFGGKSIEIIKKLSPISRAILHNE